MAIIDIRVRPHTAYFNREIWPDPHPAIKPYLERYHADKVFAAFPLTTLEASTRIMQAMGVTLGVLFGGDEESNRVVYETVQQYPKIYLGMGGVKIGSGIGPCLKEMERCFTEYGFSGIGINPYRDNIFSNDKKYYPLYAYAESMGKTVHIHSSIHYSPFTVMDLGNPKHIDEVAVDFPALRIIMGHAGRGFGMAAIWVADRHPNVYFDITSLHPRYIDPEVLHAINSFVKKKAIYGSSMPAMPFDIHEEWKRVIYDGNHRFFFHDNAARALGLSLPPETPGEAPPDRTPPKEKGKRP